jgi:colanic acid/amylovoran biosynthesis glycosyltransferase
VTRALKIALVTGAFPKLSETFVLQQVVALLQLGHDVRIFAFGASGEATRQREVDEYDLLERTRYVASPSRVSSRLVGAARNLAGRTGERFDAIVCHFGHVAEKARKLRRQGYFAGPLAAIFHAYDLTVFLRHAGNDAYRRLFDEAALLLPISRHWQRKLLELGAPASKLRVLHMGVDRTAFAYRPRSLAPGETLELLSVGRMVEKKGFAIALDAVARARAELPELRYSIVGDGPLSSQLSARVDALGLSDTVKLHGALASEALRPLMARAHALLVPSLTASDGDMEGLPVVIMEAMALGLPVIASHHSGIPELVRDGETGRTVPEGDAPALASAIVEWAREPQRWQETTQRARAAIESEFDVHTLAAELAAALAQLES